VTLYYEVHVTVAPDFDRIEQAKEIAKAQGFHMGDLLLMKRDDERSHKDMFFTFRTKIYREAISQTRKIVDALNAAGFNVLRYKIEDTLLDSKIKDRMMLLERP